jgi:Zn-finger nucleic acid-binding protein
VNDEFICPVCGLPLREIRMERGVFWACTQCGVRALSVELLRHTFTAESINPFWLRTISGAGRTGRNCPCCRHAMIEIPLAEDPEAPAVDVCRSCHFVWFDASEISGLKPREIPEPEPSLSLEAREARPLLEVQRIARTADGLTPVGAPVDAWWQQFVHFLETWLR